MEPPIEMKIPLHDYQIFAKNFVLANPYCGLFLKMGLGKAIDDKTIIPTPDGSRRVGDIKPGDRIFGKNGKPTTVLNVYHHKHKTAYKVTLSDKRSFICCDEHLIPIIQNESIQAKPLKNLLSDYKTNIGHGIMHYRYQIPLCDAAHYLEQKHDIHPYLFGVLLGIRSITNLRFGILSKLSEITQESPSTCIHNLKPLWKKVHDKSSCIAYEYRIDSIENRKQVLSGLLDIAGHSENSEHTKTAHYMVSISKQYLDIITEIVHSIGFIVETEDDITKDNILLRIYTDEELMSCPSQSNWYSYEFALPYGRTLSIINIEPVEPRDMTCFTVDADDHLYLINDYIVTHNTSVVLESLWELNPNGHVLIIAPKTIARSTWIGEIKKWNIPIRTQSLIVNKKGKQLTKQQREELYESIFTAPPTVYFINRDIVTKLVKYMGNRWPFPFVIIDESQSFKSHKSERFKALQLVRPYIYRLIELTGSPSPNGPMDLWSQIWLLDMGKRLGKNITRYRETFFNPGLIVNNYPVTWFPKAGAEDEIYRRIGDIVISMQNVKLSLPPVTYNNVYAYMEEPELKRYKKFMKTYVLDLKNGEQIEAVNAAVLSSKLSQMASGAIYTGLHTHEYEVVHEHKLELCEYIINNTDSPVIIAYFFQSDADMLLKYLPEHEIKTVMFDGSPEMVDKWNEKKIPVMLLHPASGGFGLNLQYGGETLIWYTIPWSLEQYEQTNARLYRQGQQNPVMIHHLLTDKTIDTKILQAIQKKDMSQQALLNAIDATYQDVSD